MASTVLVRSVLHRASVLLQDYAPQYQRHPEIEMVDWLNDAQVAIAKFMPSACSRVDTIKLKPGTRQSIETIAFADCKPGDGSTPAAPINGTQVLDVIRNMGSDGVTAGKSIRVVERKMLDTQNRDWHTAAATSINSFVYNPETPRYFYVTPGAHASTPVWVEIAYNAQPVPVPAGGAAGSEVYLFSGASSQTITIADEFIDDLVNYVVARANMKPNEWSDAQKASAFTSMFTGSLNAKVAALTGTNPNLRFLPFAPTPIGAGA